MRKALNFGKRSVSLGEVNIDIEVKPPTPAPFVQLTLDLHKTEK